MKKAVYSIIFSLIFFTALIPVSFAENIGTDLVMQPAQPAFGMPLHFFYELKPGSRTLDSIYIKNDSEKPHSVAIYAADGQTMEDGNFSCKSQKDEMNDIGKWLTFEKNIYYLAPGEEKIIDFNINIPSDAEQKDYKGCIAYVQDPENAENGVSFLLRKVKNVELKVTDSPNPIQKQEIARTAAPTLFFWVTISIALICILLIGYDIIRKNKKK